MHQRRDRLIAGVAALMVVALAGLVIAAVLQAQRNGRHALERLQQGQLDQVAKSMDTRVGQAFQSLQKLYGADWDLTPGSAADAKRVDAIGASLPNSAGYLIDPEGRVTNGDALEQRTTTYDDLAVVKGAGKRGAISAVKPGRAVTGAVIDLLVPITARNSKTPGGYLVVESRVGPDSGFNDEVANLGRGRTGVFSFLDGNRTVVASSDRTSIAQPFRTHVPGGLRRGFFRDDGKVFAVAKVPSAGWTAVFAQSTSEFEGELTGPLRSALLFVALAAAVLAGLLFMALLRRLRAARLEERRLSEINEAQEEFIGIVSHELRTPVAGLVGFLQTTLDHWEAMPDGDRQVAVTRAFANARRLQSLTADVLDTARIEAGDFPYSFSPVDLAVEVRSAVDAAGDVHPGHAILLHEPTGPVWVRADADRLQQVLTNVLDNALKHGPPDLPVEVTVEDEDGTARVSVADHGPGIALEDADRIFEKFVRGRASTVGTGLGLYVCRMIVEAHGGRIWAANAEGGGAVVSFTLPALDVPAPAPVS